MSFCESTCNGHYYLNITVAKYIQNINVENRVQLTKICVYDVLHYIE